MFQGKLGQKEKANLDLKKQENIKEVTEIKIDIQSQNSNSTKESFLYIFKNEGKYIIKFNLKNY